MRNLKITLFVCLLFILPTLSAQNLKARIKIDVERKIGNIDSLIYGNFTEHLGRCINPQSFVKSLFHNK